MADSTETVAIEFKVNGITKEIKNVKDYKEAVKSLQEQVDKSDFGSAEAKEASAELEKLKGKMSEVNGQAKAVDNSISKLKSDFKDLKVALANATDPKEFARLSKELNDVEGKIGDINDAANIASGSGVEQLNKGFGTIAEGFQNFDFDKIKTGFKGVGAAMSAAAPFILIEAIKFLIENFDAVVNFAKQVTGSFSEEEKQVQKLTVAYEAQVSINKKLVPELQNQIKLAEAQGKSDKEVNDIKQKLIETQIKELELKKAKAQAEVREIANNDTLIESSQRLIVQTLKAAGKDKEAADLSANIDRQKIVRSKEQLQTIQETDTAISTIRNDALIAQLNSDKKDADSFKKMLAEKLKAQQEYEALLQQGRDQDRQAELDANAEDLKIRNAAIDQQISDQQYEDDQKKQREDSAAADKAVADKKKKEDALALEKEDAAGRAIIERQAYAASKALFDAFFVYKLSATKQGSAEQTRLLKEQFEINKAFSLADATKDGYKAVLSAYADTPGGPIIKFAAGTIAGLFSAAQIAKIASSKFNSGSSSASTGLVSAPSANISLPQPPILSSTQTNASTSFDANGNATGSNHREQSSAPIKVYVTESDITEKQKGVDRIKARATI